ncbi:MAG: NUMOD3 domain-containing DNA-binding protein, partial [Gluconacetobacter sp.]
MKIMKWAPDESHDDVVYVYLLTNDINGKKYVGISYNPPGRWQEHFGGKNVISKALRKYGFENFTKEVIAVSNRKGALELEEHYCEIHNSLQPNGYNLKAGGHGSHQTSEETRSKMSAALKGRKLSLEYRAQMSIRHKGKAGTFNGRRHTKETRERMSASNKGRTGSKSMLGKKHTSETRAKIS